MTALKYLMNIQTIKMLFDLGCTNVSTGTASLYPAQPTFCTEKFLFVAINFVREHLLQDKMKSCQSNCISHFNMEFALGKRSHKMCVERTPGGGVLGLRTYGEVPLENLKSYPVPESNSKMIPCPVVKFS